MLTGLLHSVIEDKISDIVADDEVFDATIQEYPLKNNTKYYIKKDGRETRFKKDRKHMVSFSGGKDSTAMLIRMLELDMQVDDIIFADTKYEFEEMYKYIDKVEKYIQDRFDRRLKIRKVTTTEELDDWIFGRVTRGKHKGEVRGFPLTLFPCTWSRESKVKPLNKVMQGHHRYIGIAVDEKKRVSKHADDMLLHYPLIEWGWTEEDCMDYLKKIGLINPLYTDEISRTGCWWCPKQSIGSWRSLYFNHHSKWEELKQMEKKVGRPVVPNSSMLDMEERFKREVKQTNNG